MDFKDYQKQEDARIAICIGHLEAGVNFVDIRTAYIDENVKIGAGTVIGPCVTLEGNTIIGKNCCILQNSRIENSVVGDGVEIQSSVVVESEIGEGTKVGPFAYLRPGSRIGKDCKVGDFVEVKNSSFGDGSKASHLTYIGDSDVGRDVNIGCGVVFVNYDGTHKHRTTVGDSAFIGCNTNLVSPVKVEDGAYIAAGSTVTEDVPEDALCIARARQKNIRGWAAEKGLYRK
ncbi:UDP-N-acetylglucosamine diphosphorylase [Ihubacter sp. rT4E-8]|uniref:UDP-N-acetylglucosamine diphosphorylase n=1 Tax=Ihubacter sp. rT4E-8 TaxID=3242369 RepID=UPI003CEF467C